MLQTRADKAERSLYAYEELRPLFHPDSIAIVGASQRQGSFGLRTINNLSEFDGRIYPVNPRYDQIAGHKCYPDIGSIPEKVDCAVIAVAAEQVEAMVAESVRAGVGGVIIYAGGFSETGRPDLVAMQERLVAQVRGTKTRLLGPNCLGLTNYARGARILFGRMPETKPLGEFPIGIVSQSGSVNMSLGQVVERGVSVSHTIPVGNSGDVALGDVVAYLAQDPACKAIVCVFEGASDASRLVQAIELATERGKAVIIYKMAVGTAGAQAALSHTGALAGSHRAYVAALEAAGAVMLDNMEDLIETAVFFAKAGRPTGTGAAVIVGSGGLGVISADKAEEFGVPLHQPSGHTLDVLKANVPEFGAARNPCDVTAMALNDEGPLEACAAAFLEDRQYSTMIVVHPYADAIGSARVNLWHRLHERYGKIICSYWSSEWLEGYGAREVEAEPGIATFRSLRRCFAAIAAWQKREATIERRKQAAARVSPQSAKAEAAKMLEAAGDKLTEREAKAVLDAYGVPTVPERLTQNVDEAAAACADFGYPAVLKVESPDILHKTEAGVVRLGIRDEAGLREAFAEIMENARKVAGARINGVLVQPMVPRGLELMLGAQHDDQFGPMVLVGFGGVMIELLKDASARIAPVSKEEALVMLDELKSREALDGFRGIPAVNREKLAEIAARFSEFVADHAEIIGEVDVNPLICAGDRIVAVDALIAKKGEAR
jgi:acetyl-CoA synthetase